MQIKKISASSLKEATSKMKLELGENAVILSTKVLQNPKTGGRVFEITCGLEDDYDKLESLNKKIGSSKTKNKTFSDELKTLQDKINLNQPAAKSHGKIKSALEGNVKLKKGSTETISSISEQDFHEAFDLLLHRDVQKRTADAIIEQLRKYSGILTRENIDAYITSIIASMLNISKFEIEGAIKPKTVAIVGPTGVGKTTCIAKLAVISKILYKLNVGLISIDTYRLGAIDQLKIFSEIANVEMNVAFEPEDMKSILKQYKNKDIVFIDTAGRSQNNQKLLQDMVKFMNAANVEDVYLALSLTSSTKTAIDIAEKFKALNYNGLIFTKLDEAVAYGNILNISSSFGAPIKYLTNGQIIPDDIIAPDADFISNLIFSGKLNK